MLTWRGPSLLDPTWHGNARAFGSRPARQELLLAAGNPKAILIFTAAFPQFVDQTVPALPQFAVIGLTFLVTEWVVAALYALAGSQLDAVRSTRWARLPNKLFGGLFIAAASLLTAARRA